MSGNTSYIPNSNSLPLPVIENKKGAEGHAEGADQVSIHNNINTLYRKKDCNHCQSEPT